MQVLAGLRWDHGLGGAQPLELAADCQQVEASASQISQDTVYESMCFRGFRGFRGLAAVLPDWCSNSLRCIVELRDLGLEALFRGHHATSAPTAHGTPTVSL